MSWRVEATACVEKLAEYEELEEQGLLVRLPCKVGDKLFVINNERVITEEKVCDVEYRGVKYKQGCRFFINIGATAHLEQDFGERVFYTREQAEQALKEMEEKHG